MNALEIDAFEFCRLKESRAGEFAISDLPRLSAELIDEATGVLKWSLQGGMDRFGHAQMTLSVTGAVQLRCQRCMTGMDFSIASGSILVLAPNEESVDAVEALVDDDEVDVIAGSRNFDVIALVEDEALLALPVAPKHAACPKESLPDAGDHAEKESPFSVLKNLKR